MERDIELSVAHPTQAVANAIGRPDRQRRGPLCLAKASFERQRWTPAVSPTIVAGDSTPQPCTASSAGEGGATNSCISAHGPVAPTRDRCHGDASEAG